MADTKPNLNARVHDEDRQRFKTLVKTQGLTDADFFSQLLLAWEAQGGEAPIEMPKELIGLQQTLGHVADIVRGIWAQAAADKKRFEDTVGQAQKSAEEKLAAVTAEAAYLKIALAESEAAQKKAFEEARTAQAALAVAKEERQTLFSLTQTQSERIRKLERFEPAATALPEVQAALEVTKQSLSEAEKKESAYRHRHAVAETDVAKLKEQLDSRQADWQADKERLVKALADTERELAIFKERSEQLQARLNA